MKQRPNIVLAVSLLVMLITGFTLGFVTGKKGLLLSQTSTINGEKNDPEKTAPEISNLDEVWNILHDSYYDPAKLEGKKMSYGALKGFVDAVEDPYTGYMTPDESKEFDQDLEGELEGIGAELESKSGKLVVVTPLKNSPAEKAGIKPGDIIYKIDGAVAEKMTLQEAVGKIRGKEGTAVTISIIRESLKESFFSPLEFKVTREKITLDTVTVKKLEGGIFHVAVNQFNDHTTKELDRAIQDILLEKARGVIIDLRGNGGGYLNTAVDVLSRFISGEKPVVITKEKNPDNAKTISTSGNPALPDIPLVVLVNRGSASASEIVAGALQDYKRAVIIGEKTFGKGSVQEISTLNDGSSLRFTVAKWFTPLNRSIDGTGITPDIEVPFTEEDEKAKKDPQLERAVEYLKGKN